MDQVGHMLKDGVLKAGFVQASTKLRELKLNANACMRKGRLMILAWGTKHYMS